MKIEILNRSRERIPESLLTRDARSVVRMLGRTNGVQSVTIVCVRPNESQRLRWKYLKKNKPANVLSFNYGDYAEVILTPAVIYRDARREGVPGETALRRMLIHGLLHVQGFDHEGTRARARSFERWEKTILTKHGIQ